MRLFLAALIIAASLVSILSQVHPAFADTSGPNYPSAVTTESVTPEDDNDWTSAANVGADDGSEASITAATYDANDISFRLKAQGFGFSIPASATIDGILVEIEKRDGNIGNAVDQRVQLLDADGALVGANKADTATGWPTSITKIDYGGSADTWTASPTPAMVNDPDFGVVLSAKATAANTDIFVDYIRVTITYTGGSQQFDRDISQGVTVDNTLGRTLLGQRTISQSVTVGNTLAEVTTYVRNVAQSMTVAPSVTNFIHLFIDASQSITADDDLARVVIYVRNIGQSVTIDNMLERGSVNFQRGIDLTVTLVDQLSCIFLGNPCAPPAGETPAPSDDGGCILIVGTRFCI